MAKILYIPLSEGGNCVLRGGGKKNFAHCTRLETIFFIFPPLKKFSWTPLSPIFSYFLPTLNKLSLPFSLIFFQLYINFPQFSFIFSQLLINNFSFFPFSLVFSQLLQTFSPFLSFSQNLDKCSTNFSQFSPIFNHFLPILDKYTPNFSRFFPPFTNCLLFLGAQAPL